MASVHQLQFVIIVWSSYPKPSAVSKAWKEATHNIKPDSLAAQVDDLSTSQTKAEQGLQIRTGCNHKTEEAGSAI